MCRSKHNISQLSLHLFFYNSKLHFNVEDKLCNYILLVLIKHLQIE